ncbi:PepSY-associated TM helix domain-containing protein [uncultured Campylobacter sp.]|uniref:PepSY-associated TM helix domain-containing protein n=1 Tax=uncultured Campylobacter sp. TaxID=218934 RepID=UPI0026175020|nr:PepSY-associated TM helix domain-containing protein [uncultured Campylobacter sp.]
MAILKRKKFWFNVHLVLTLICCMPILIVALSGAIISYHDEIIDVLNQSKSFVSPSGKDALKPTEILNIFRKVKPGFTLSYYRIPQNKNEAIRLSGTDSSGEFKSYFIDPYSGEITSENIGDTFIGVVLNLHTNLGFGLSKNETLRLIGKNIVALSTVMFILVLISGVVIYYPSFRGKILRAFRINFKARGYTFLYSLHGVVGVLLLPVLLTISASGLYWSYDRIAKITNRALGEKEIFRKTSFTEVRGFSLEDEDKILNLQTAFDIFKRERGENYEFFNIIAQKDGENFMVFYFDKGEKSEEHMNTMSINVKKGILRHARYDDTKSTMPRPFAIHKAVLSVHSGYIFGEAGKFLFCVATISVLFFIVTGFWMSIKRIYKKR